MSETHKLGKLDAGRQGAKILFSKDKQGRQ